MRPEQAKPVLDRIFAKAERTADGCLARGERAGRARLTSAKVKTLRFAHAKYGIPITDIGRRYGVTYQAIRAVILRLTWRHV